MNSFCYCNSAYAKVELTDLVLKTDVNGCYYLGAKYRIENENSIRELHIPKMFLNVRPNNVIIRHAQESSEFPNADGLYELCLRPEVNIGFGYMPLAYEDPRNKIFYTETVIEEKTHEMTLDDIEEKLGYKVKIVSKKEEK